MRERGKGRGSGPGGAVDVVPPGEAGGAKPEQEEEKAKKKKKKKRKRIKIEGAKDMREIYSKVTAYVMKDNEMRSISTGDERAMRNSLFPQVSASPEEWNHGVAAALNHLGRWKMPAVGGKAPSAHAFRLAENLSALVKRNAMWEVSESDVSFTDFFARKNVDYCGDEVKLTQKLFWPAISESFAEGVASLELSRFCRLGTKAYVERFDDFLLPEENWAYTKPPRVMIEDEHWFDVCKGLVSAGVCEVFPIDDPPKVGDKPLLNGMFSVGKGEFKDGIETQRLIMSLIPVNHLCRSLEGAILLLSLGSRG